MNPKEKHKHRIDYYWKMITNGSTWQDIIDHMTAAGLSNSTINNYRNELKARINKVQNA